MVPKNVYSHTEPRFFRTLVIIFACMIVLSCGNNPYRSGESEEETFFTSFSTELKKMDPATSYFSYEADVIDQIYEFPFQYHFLKRPYELIPLLAEEIPVPVYFDKEGNRLPANPAVEKVGRVEYTVRIKQGVLYQDHACFAKDDNGESFYKDITASDLKNCDSPYDLPVKDTRELKADDFALQIRRIADVRLGSPIISTVERYVLGFTELKEEFSGMVDEERARRKAKAGAAYNQEQDERSDPIIIDYMKPDFPGVEVIDQYTYKIVLKRKYPQILYWMAMHFFSPMPQEALDLYSLPAMRDKQFGINKCPVGTGPYFLKTYLPNREIVLERNRNYHGEFYPTQGEPGDREAGFLDDAGEPVPFINRIVFKHEKESIPRWTKFLQGYFDTSSISEEVFDQAIDMTAGDEPDLSDDMKEKGIRLVTSVNPSTYYLGFNMLDDVVGGYTVERQKLRQAISIAVDYNEYLDIFMNGRGIQAQSPIPPGIFGSDQGESGTNPYTDVWDPVRERNVRRPIEDAKKLMVEAGFSGGRDKDGKPLVLHLDHYQGGRPAFATQFEWMKKRFALIGIRLEDRGTNLSQFRENLDTGNLQIFNLGWLADYPDPENFVFLLYGENARVGHHGENGVNYANPEYDELFRQMESMENGPERKEIIDEMLEIARRDAPWVFGFHSVGFSLFHEWYYNAKPNSMGSNYFKYKRIDPKIRTERQKEWNKPKIWVIVVLVAFVFVALVPAAVTVYRSERGR